MIVCHNSFSLSLYGQRHFTPITAVELPKHPFALVLLSTAAVFTEKAKCRAEVKLRHFKWKNCSVLRNLSSRLVCLLFDHCSSVANAVLVRGVNRTM